MLLISHDLLKVKENYIQSKNVYVIFISEICYIVSVKVHWSETNACAKCYI